jgi:GTP cyclohydrolase FolE2
MSTLVPKVIQSAIPDVQSSADTRRIPINKVGIKDIRHPVRVRDRSGGEQHTVARFAMYVNLPHDFKGTHMSRFVEILNAHEREITVEARVRDFVWVEELIDLVEEEASCELWGLLKRPDEKYVTEHAYDNPKFVEDLVRDIAVRLNADDRIAAYSVASENFESIHNHSAYALIERDKESDPPAA